MSELFYHLGSLSSSHEFIGYNFMPTIGQWVILIATVFIAWMCLEFGANEKADKSYGVQMDSIEGEYEFLNQIDSIDSQLDLARAYISMGDNKAALSILFFIFKNGNDEQIKQAQDLYQQIER